MAAYKPKILTFDLGTRTGWAFQDIEGLVHSGIKDFSSFRKEGAGMRGLRFRRWLEKTFVFELKPDVVYFEEVRRHSSVGAAHVYGTLSGMLMAWCEENCTPYSSVPVGTIKKAATGKGNASKHQMIAAAIRTYGIMPKTDDEADALGILTYALNTE